MNAIFESRTGETLENAEGTKVCGGCPECWHAMSEAAHAMTALVLHMWTPHSDRSIFHQEFDTEKTTRTFVRRAGHRARGRAERPRRRRRARQASGPRTCTVRSAS